MSFPYFSNVLIPFPVTARNSWVVTGPRAANARNVRSLKIRNAGRLRLLASVKRQVRSAALSRDSSPACGGFRFAPGITESLGLTDRVPRQDGTAEVAAHEQGASVCKDAPYDLAGRFDPCNRATVNFYAIPPPLLHLFSRARQAGDYSCASRTRDRLPPTGRHPSEVPPSHRIGAHFAHTNPPGPRCNSNKTRRQFSSGH
jgi:hypothetical protein